MFSHYVQHFFQDVCSPCCAAHPPWKNTQSGCKQWPARRWDGPCPAWPGTETTPSPWRSVHSAPGHSPPAPIPLRSPLTETHRVHQNLGLRVWRSRPRPALSHAHRLSSSCSCTGCVWWAWWRAAQRQRTGRDRRPAPHTSRSAGRTATPAWVCRKRRSSNLTGRHAGRSPVPFSCNTEGKKIK